MDSLVCKDTLLWRDVRTSAALFGLLLFLLSALSFYSVLTVVTCLAIPLITVMLMLRAIWVLKCAFLKETLDNPFQSWLDKDIELNNDKIATCNKQFLLVINDVAICIRKIVLVADLLDTAKALGVLFFLYYMSNNFGGITLLFACVVIAFTIPKIFDLYQDDICRVTKGFTDKYNDVYARIKAAIPYVGAEKEKTK